MQTYGTGQGMSMKTNWDGDEEDMKSCCNSCCNCCNNCYHNYNCNNKQPFLQEEEPLSVSLLSVDLPTPGSVWTHSAQTDTDKLSVFLLLFRFSLMNWHTCSVSPGSPKAKALGITVGYLQTGCPAQQRASKHRRVKPHCLNVVNTTWPQYYVNTAHYYRLEKYKDDLQNMANEWWLW